ncbi:hypothetical protein BD310DRAFT_830281 [Dichomitus squalens]|uniref:Uncharacterized protein n=1 Tax=Dichomitus squalens TaxID=114155 RepID=A0A4Q9PEH8_9APHY|nr:hypothetical protein BD310DRAFT_830281 [Dichomitus squalens]
MVLAGESSHTVGRTLTYVSVVLVIYDWLLSLPRGVRLFHAGTSRGISTYIFISNTYIHLVNQCLLLCTYASLSEKVCKSSLLNTNYVWSYLSMIPPALFTGLRAFALSQKWSVAILTFVLSFMPVATGMIEFGYHPTGSVDPILGCLCVLGRILRNRGLILLTVTVITRIGTILADALLIALTMLSFNGSTVRQAASTISTKSLMGIMLRDDIANHCSVSPSTLCRCISHSASYFPISHSSISCMITSHFMLDLQEAHQRKVVGLASNDPLYISNIGTGSLRSPSILGSLSAHIEAPRWDIQGPNFDEEAKANIAEAIIPDSTLRLIVDSVAQGSPLHNQSTLVNVTDGAMDGEAQV